MRDIVQIRKRETEGICDPHQSSFLFDSLKRKVQGGGRVGGVDGIFLSVTVRASQDRIIYLVGTVISYDTTPLTQRRESVFFLMKPINVIRAALRALPPLSHRCGGAVYDEAVQMF